MSFMQRIRSKQMSMVYKMTCVMTLMAVTFCILTSFVVANIYRVSVVEDGEEISSFISIQKDTEQLMLAANIELNVGDQAHAEQTDNKIVLNIERAFPVTIASGEERITLMTAATTVEELLKTANVSYGATDKIAPTLDEIVTADSTITVVKCSTENITVKKALDFETETQKTNALYEGESRMVKEGQKGEKVLTYKVSYEDGKETERTLLSTTVTKEPVNAVKEIGTKKKNVVTVNGKEMTYSQMIRVNATAYSPSCDGGSKTCLGVTPYRGIVAVDPSVIPLGTKMYIASSDGSYVYGYCVAGDTGGAIKGNRVDLFMDSKSECNAFGRRAMNVYILN